MRASAAGLVLAVLLAVPPVAATQLGLTPETAALAAWLGFAHAVDAVGWVLVPQLALAIGVFGLALRRSVFGLGGLPSSPTPGWLDPAVESALLLGMLGTLSGMVRGFVGLSPDEIEPGPLVHALGLALRSSFVGFGIALVGVWLKERGPVEGAPA